VSIGHFFGVRREDPDSFHTSLKFSTVFLPGMKKLIVFMDTGNLTTILLPA
jgi:hypothetical protein